MEYLLSLHVTKLRGLPPLFPLLPSGSTVRLRVQCDLKLESPPTSSSLPSSSLSTSPPPPPPDAEAASTPNCYLSSSKTSDSSLPRSSSKGNEVHWDGEKGLLKFKLTQSDLKRLRAYSAKIKLHVYAVATAAAKVNEEKRGTKGVQEEEEVDAKDEDEDDLRSGKPNFAPPASRTVEALGWVTVDLLAVLENSSSSSSVPSSSSSSAGAEWLKVHGCKSGAELFVQSRLTPLPRNLLSPPAAAAAVAAAAPAAAGPIAVLPPPLSAYSDHLPIGRGDELFNCRISIKACGGLMKLHPPTIDLQGAWFSYAAFGVVVQTERFFTFDTNESFAAVGGSPLLFKPVCDVFRIRSSSRELREYFDNQSTKGGVAVHLCCNGMVVASAKVDLAKLFENEGGDWEEGDDEGGGDEMEDKCVQGRFRLLTKEQRKEEKIRRGDMIQEDDTKEPWLMVEVTLSKTSSARDAQRTQGLKKDQVTEEKTQATTDTAESAAKQGREQAMSSAAATSTMPTQAKTAAPAQPLSNKNGTERKAAAAATTTTSRNYVDKEDDKEEKEGGSGKEVHRRDPLANVHQQQQPPSSPPKAVGKPAANKAPTERTPQGTTTKKITGKGNKSSETGAVFAASPPPLAPSLSVSLPPGSPGTTVAFSKATAVAARTPLLRAGAPPPSLPTAEVAAGAGGTGTARGRSTLLLRAVVPRGLAITADAVDDMEEKERRGGVRIDVVSGSSRVCGSSKPAMLTTNEDDYSSEATFQYDPIVIAETFLEATLSCRVVAVATGAVIGTAELPPMPASEQSFELDLRDDASNEVGSITVILTDKTLAETTTHFAPSDMNASADGAAKHVYRLSVEMRHLSDAATVLPDDCQGSVVSCVLHHSASQLGAKKQHSSPPFDVSSLDGSSSIVTVPVGAATTTVYEFIGPAQVLGAADKTISPLIISLSLAKQLNRNLAVAKVDIQSLLRCGKSERDLRPTFYRCPITQKTFASPIEYKAHAASFAKASNPNAGKSDGPAPIGVYAVAANVPLETETGSDAALNVAIILEDLGEGDGVRKFLGRGGETVFRGGKTGSARSGGQTGGNGMFEESFVIEPVASPLEVDVHDQSMMSMGGGGSPQRNFTEYQHHHQHNQYPQEHRHHNSVDPTIALASAAAAIEIDRLRREFESWRHRAELEWHESLRLKEAASVRALEERALKKEKEKAEAIAQAQGEYAKLETRLRKTLAEVEQRERKLKQEETTRAAEYAQKMAEVQMLTRRGREEAKHLVDLAQAKTQAEKERADNAVAVAAQAERRVKIVEEDFEHYRSQQRKSPESALLQEIATLKGKLADAESKVHKERAERNQALLEKEQFKAHIHRLARALKREREKTAATARRELEQLRLEYVAREQRFILDGDRHELGKIKAELKALSEQDMIREQANLHAGSERRDVFEAPRAVASKLTTAGGAAAAGANSGASYSPAAKKKSAFDESSLQAFASPGSGDEGWNEQPVVSAQTPPSVAAFKTNSPQPKKGGMSAAEAEAELLRLESEKEELLSTGVFDAHHPIITQLDRMMDNALQELAKANDQ